MLDKKALRTCVAEHGEHLGDLARALRITQTTLSHRINGNSEFKRSEIELIKDRYSLSPAQVDLIFFATLVSHYDTAKIIERPHLVPTNKMQALGRRIRLGRSALGVTQTELGDRVGLKKSTVAKYENGQLTDIPLSRLLRFAEALGVSVSELIGDED